RAGFLSFRGFAPRLRVGRMPFLPYIVRKQHERLTAASRSVEKIFVWGELHIRPARPMLKTISSDRSR
ncbi:MAG: hypothetical protein VX201_10315, partial [Pseudomonadota bacterium]|nr:hypothetical protein [Pseudomonadota bacterium]